ncbi:MAG TPA: hypothetical protein VFR80_03600, partial [Pyrinomonadaceae bacterium]|nr:hypothetical protein [Pyrinomonadaceae bacterium]
MSLLRWRFFNVALLLTMAVAMPGVINAQTPMNEIPVGTGGTGAAQTFSFGGSLDGEEANSAGPEAAAFDGTYLWVASQFRDSVTRIRASDNALAGTFTVCKGP